MTRFTEHKPGRLGAYECPTGKRTYETERFALRALRHQREHGEIRRSQGSVYPCPDRTIPRHWHTTSSRPRKALKR